MSSSIMPAFVAFPKEAAVIGRILSGFGELEYLFGMCLASTVDDDDSVLKAYFGLKVESARIGMAYTLMKSAYSAIKLGDRLECCRAQTKFCQSVRNTFSHCHWGHTLDDGLFYVNLEDSAQSTTNFRSSLSFLHVDEPLLKSLEEYFVHTSKRLTWVAAEYRLRHGKVRKNIFSWPKGTPQPKLHNPPDQHVPPWTRTYDDDLPSELGEEPPD